MAFSSNRLEEDLLSLFCSNSTKLNNSKQYTSLCYYLARPFSNHADLKMITDIRTLYVAQVYSTCCSGAPSEPEIGPQASASVRPTHPHLVAHCVMTWLVARRMQSPALHQASDRVSVHNRRAVDYETPLPILNSSALTEHLS